MARGGAEVIRGGRGYSTRKVQKGDVVIRTISGGGGGRRNSSVIKRTPNVKVNGFSVIIDGKGFSVPLSEQAKFIRERTGGVGASASAAIKQAEKAAEEASRKAAQEIKRKAAQDLARLKEVAAVSSATQKAQIAREQLRLEAIRRGRAFTRLEAQRFLRQKAGPRAITNLRAGNRADRGFIKDLRGSITENKKAITQLRAEGLNPVLNRAGFVTGFTSPDTQKSYTYSNTGIEQYTKDSKGAGAIIRRKLREDSQTGQSVRLTTGQEARKFFRERINKNRNEIKKLNTQIKNLIKSGDKEQALKLAKEKNRLQNELIGFKAGDRITEFIQGASQIPRLIKTLFKDPRTIVPLTAAAASGIKADWKDTIQLAKISPKEAIAKVGTDYLTFAAIGKTLKVTGKVTSKVARRLNPKWKSLKSGVITIKVPKESLLVRGKNLIIGKSKPVRKVTLKTGVIGKGTSLSKQASLAGTRGTIVTAQAERLVNFLRRKKIIRKPIPGEENLTSITKRLLKKFDDGKITKTEFNKLNTRLIKETGDKTLLERTLFADPKGTIRFTRLGGDVAEANLRDIFRGNFKIRKSRPQVIVFPEGQIAKFPKSLKDVVRKLKASKKLTAAERNRLVKWQVSNKGKSGASWKPVGDVKYKGGVELEVTLAPGNVIRRVKKIAITEINGVPVEIIQAKVVRLKPTTSSLLKKARRGTAKLNELKKLKRLLSKETKLPVRLKDLRNLSKNLRRRGIVRKPYLPVGRKIARRVITGSRLVKRKKKTIRRKSGGRKVVKRKVAIKKRTRKPTSRKRTRRGRTRTSGRGKESEKPISLKLGKFNKRNLRKKQPTYFVVKKKRGKLVKLTAKPMVKSDAKDYLAYNIDKGLERSAFIIPYGKFKKVIKLPSKIKGYFRKNSRKLRPYKIRYGKKKKIVNGYIEKKKYALDTAREKAQIKSTRRKRTRKSKPIRRKTTKRKVSRRITRPKKMKRVTRRTRKRRITPTQRRKLLQNLKKARRVRRRKNKN